jgi:hypothetical protein
MSNNQPEAQAVLADTLMGCDSVTSMQSGRLTDVSENVLPPSSRWKNMPNNQLEAQAVLADSVLWDDTVQSGRSLPTIRKNALPPSSGPNSKPSKRNMKMVHSIKSQSYRSTRLHIPQDSTFHSPSCRNLKFNTSLYFWGARGSAVG